MIVAIDGPAGAGKSTVARAVAVALGATYLDTGAMYRCVALASLDHSEEEPGAIAERISIELAPGQVTLEGRDVGKDIRTPEVSAAASRTSADPRVREAMVAKQRELLHDGGDWVAEGRDIGTVVAPDAELKVFLTAAPEERARRRALELGIDEAAVLEDQLERDTRDAERAHSPLKQADDAVLVDTTGMPLDQVVEQIVRLAQRVRA